MPGGFGGFGSRTTPDIKLSPDAKSADAKADTKKTPEHQLNKLREQARSGGAGGWGGSGGGAGSNAPITPKAESLPPPPLVREQDDKAIVLDLAPQATDKDMEHLLGILNTKGFYACLDELDRMNNPHVEDDFHRLMVQYKKEGHKIPGLKGKHDIYGQAIDTTLFEITVPVAETIQGGPGQQANQTLAEIVSAMEQLILGMTPFFGMPDPVFFKEYVNEQIIMREHFTMEIAVSDGREEAVFYISVPHKRQESFEKMVLALFPRARVKEEKDDYNPFNQFGHIAAARGALRRPYGLAIRTAPEQFQVDPMNVTLSAFSKLTREGEGAALQIMVAPAGEYFRRKVVKLRDKFRTGKDNFNMTAHKLRIKSKDPWWRVGPTEFFKEFIAGFSDKKEDHKEQAHHPGAEKDPKALENLDKKLKAPLVGVNIRLVASARTPDRAHSMLEDMKATFGQYDDSDGNRIVFHNVKGTKKIRDFTRKFIWRLFERATNHSIFPEWFAIFSHPFINHKILSVMNTKEIATIYHLTLFGGTSSREVKRTKSRLAPAPPHLPQKGILLGRNRYANSSTDIFLTPDDRLRHLYTIGQTGTGKTTFLKNMIVQDIENGEGLCFIDPHGVDVLDLLSRIPPHRMDDVVYFDPAHLERPMGLNMLEYDPRSPEQKTFVVDEMFKIFKKLYGDVPEAFGPIFEQYFRNAAGLVVEDPETGSTLMDISRVLADEDFRHLKLSRSRNPVINHFWEDVAGQVRGEGSLANVVPYITSKFDIFIANEIMRPVVGQQRSAFNFKEIMDNKKILLVNLSKGRLGDINANLIGLVLVGKILMAALGRAEYLYTNPPPFYLYLDEFQNVTTDTIATILSEARKYRLSLTIAHQFIGQLEGDRIKESIKNAVFGNVGTMVIFRVGVADGQFLEPQFKPTFNQGDMINLDNFNAYVKLLAEGKPVTPTFSMETLAFRSGDPAQVDAVKQMSYQRYGRPREAVEEEIRHKYQGMHGK